MNFYVCFLTLRLPNHCHCLEKLLVDELSRACSFVAEENSFPLDRLIGFSGESPRSHWSSVTHLMA